ncbi:hypothetical protein RclHR1_00870008 [Rhizophagus clarus]|uniref:Reverse transcriptase domain-containing protein n=1 Tax=Rhizophagus clarus TaxID=94130 RepID=A0A2Z6SNS3_9GLOM|nr:hypothetical protein RclHR1_00870008 [Rhizophagus clarus]
MIIEEELDDKDKDKIFNILIKYENALKYNQDRPNLVSDIKHKIIIEEGKKPILQKRYRESPDKREFIRKEIRKMLKVNRIRESYSPWASPVILAKKKSNSYRFCIDYRKLNANTIPDAYPLPRIDELLERYQTAKWFTSVDLASGFHQVEMEETDKEKTAFICSEGLYEFNVMPFGLRNAPGTFQRMMDKILREYIGNFVEIYIDDIMIYSKNLEEHIEHIEKVLQRLQKYNLVIKLKKCKFCQKKIEFLGHEIGNDGLKSNFKKIETIDKIKEPRTIAKPLIELTKKEVDFNCSDECQKSFNELKRILVKNPILAHSDFNKEFILITDASAVGLGAILSQKNDEDKEVVIAYASKSTNSNERNYPITDLECLAIIWAVRHFHKFLINNKFKIITDHAALKSLMKDKEPKGRRARWMMELQQYNFEIIHRSGKLNTNADALSRLKFRND